MQPVRSSPDLAWLARRLRTALRGSVETGPARWPVVRPADEADLRMAMEIAAQAGVPVGVCGQDPGAPRPLEALLVDCRRLDSVHDFDAGTGVLEAGAGVLVEAVEAIAGRHGWQLPVEASGAERATLGGLLAVDARLRLAQAGRIGLRVDAIDALLADGTFQHFGPFGAEDSTRLATPRASALVSGLFSLAERERDLLARDWPAAVTPSLGFPFPALGAVPGAVGDAGTRPSLARLLVGSRGTLAVMARIRLRLARRPAHRRALAVVAEGFAAGLACLAPLAGHRPVMGELFDAPALARARGLAGLASNRGALLVVEFEGDDMLALDARVARARADCHAGGAHALELDQAAVLRLAGAARELSSQLEREAPGPGTTIVPEDCRVPGARLTEVWAAIDALCRARSLRVRWHASAIEGRLSMRPLDLASARAMVRDGSLAVAVARLVREHGGAVDGARLAPAARRALLPLQFGEPLAAACEQARALFDPQDRLVPCPGCDAGAGEAGDSAPSRAG